MRLSNRRRVSSKFKSGSPTRVSSPVTAGRIRERRPVSEPRGPVVPAAADEVLRHGADRATVMAEFRQDLLPGEELSHRLGSLLFGLRLAGREAREEASRQRERATVQRHRSLVLRQWAQALRQRALAWLR